MTKKIYFENLDAIRFLCFLSVFFHHSFYSELEYIKGNEWYSFIKHDIFRNGNLGVNFFFVLSGFLITYLLIEEKKLNGQISIPKFWIRRVLRIWPLFYFCVFFGFVVFPQIKILFGQIPLETADPLMYISFLNNFDLIKSGLPDSSMLGIIWSIAIEEQFYFIWPIFIYFIPFRRLWILFVSLIGISLVYRSFYTYHDLNFEYHTLSCMSDLTIGASAAWLVLISKKFKEHIINLNRTIIAFIYIGFVGFYFFRDEFVNYIPYTHTIERLLISLFIIYIILEQTYSKNSYFKMGKFKVLSNLGQISYGLYCLHFIAILIVNNILTAIGANDELWKILIIETPIALLTSIIISKISYRYFESPFLKLKTKFQFITK